MRTKRVVALSLITTFIVSLLSGCTKGTENTGDAQAQKTTSSAMGRYLEEEIPLPGGKQRILNIRFLDNGSIAGIMESDEGMMALWSTTDYGKNWEQQYEIPISAENQEFISEAVIFNDGSILYGLYLMDKEEYWRMDKDGNKTQLNIDLPEVEEMDGVINSRAFPLPEDIESSDNQGIEMGAQIITSNEISEEDLANGVVPNEDANDRGSFAINEDFSMQNGVRRFIVGQTDEVIVETMMNQILRIDAETGEVIKTYPVADDDYIVGVSIVNNKLYIETESGIECYDLETGNNLEVEEALADKAANNDSASNSGYMDMMKDGLAITAKIGDATGAIYLADNTGVYRQSEDGTILEQIMDMSLTSLSVPSVVVNEMIVMEDDSFLIHASGENYGDDNLYHYVYSADAKAMPESEIRVYSLAENREIRQAIALFQKANPDIMVSLQVGITGEEGITVSDALNTLNTEIMAGKGPDLLILDGMPIDSYIEKGILADISDVVNEIDEQSGLLESIKNDYAIASRISVPFVQGEDQYVEAIKDMATLNAASKAAKEADPEQKGIAGYSIEELMRYLYRIDVNNFITADGELAESSLQNFLECAKEMAQNNKIEAADTEESSAGFAAIESELTMGANMAELDAMGVAMELVSKSVKLGRGEVKTQGDLATIIATNEKMNMMYKIVTDDEGKSILLTNTILGINDKSEQIEKAKAFLSFCLAKEAQMSSQGMGLPVTKEALSETLNKDFDDMGFMGSSMSETGMTEMFELLIKKPATADIEAFEAIIRGETRIGYANDIVQEIVMEQLMNYVEERMTLDEAVEAISKKVSLYLSE